MASSARVTSDYEDDDFTAGNSQRMTVLGGRGVLSRKTWICSHCTLRNPSSIHICEACSRTNAGYVGNSMIANEESTDESDEDQLDDGQTSSGWTCVCCTFYNNSMAHICEICGKTHENHQQQFEKEDVKPGLTRGRKHKHKRDNDDEKDKRKRQQQVRIRRIQVDNDLDSVDESLTVIRLIDSGYSEADSVQAVKDFGVYDAEEYLGQSLDRGRRTIGRQMSDVDHVELTQPNRVEDHKEEQPNSPLQRFKIFLQDRVASKLIRSKNKFLLMVTLVRMDFKVRDVFSAMDGNCTSVNEALTLIESKRECLCCLDKYTANKMLTLFCQHEMCRPCAVRHFTERIRDHSNVNEVVCPVNGCSDDRKSDYEYFNMLANQLKPLLDKKVFDLFQTKLRDQTIGKINDFMYCTKCPGFGFEYDPYHESVTCPVCQHSMCPKCKADWTDDHRGRSCDEVENIQTTERYIENTLNQQGIQCPKCEWKFELTRGGCMHFTCTQCKHEFCEGCSQEFFKNKCKVFADCKMNFHAHHPRGCPYYMRDNSVADLQRLFQINDVAIPASKLSSDNGQCRVIIQESSVLKEKPCNAPSAEVYQGLCERHYKEHLTSCIYKLQLDPVYIFDEDKLIRELRRNRIKVPARVAQETHVDYVNRLVEIVIAEVPYDFKWSNRL